MDEKRKPTQAVALEYDPADNAPKVIAMDVVHWLIVL